MAVVTFTTDEAAIRHQIESHILLAFPDIVGIYEDPSFLPNTELDEVRAFVKLQNIVPQKAGGTAGMNEASWEFHYEIIIQAPFPTGSTLEVSKITYAQSLITQLTSLNYPSTVQTSSGVFNTTPNAFYAGSYQRRIGEITFGDIARTEQTERYFTITVNFFVEATTNA